MSVHHREETSVEELRANTAYVILALLVGGWLLWDAAYVRLVIFAPFADYWEHSALLTEWLRNFADPSNPHVADSSLSSRYMPWYWVLTYFGLIFQFDAVELLAIAGVIHYVLIVIGLFVFLRAYFKDYWAPVIGFIAIFFCWGVSWNWSNLYHLRSFFYVAGYPSTFVFGLGFFAFALVIKILRRDGSVLLHGIALCALSALMFLAHPLTGVYAIVGCGLLALTQTSVSFSLRVFTVIMLGVGTVFAEAWPYFSVWKVSLGLYGSGEEQWFAAEAASMTPLERLRSGIWMHIFYNPRLVLTILGPALLGVPVVIWLLIRRQHLFIVLGAAAMAFPYLLHPFVEVPLAHRFLLFVVTYLQLAIVWAVLQVIEAWNLRPRPAQAGSALAVTVLAIALLMAFNVWLVAIEFDGRTLSPKTLEITDKGKRLPDGLNVVELYERLTDPLPDDAVVLATPLDGWPLPTVKGKVVSLYHENPLLLDQQQRYVATTDFFETALSDGQRSAIIRRYRPGYLLINGMAVAPGLEAWLANNARLASVVGDYRMFRLLDAASAAAPEPYFRDELNPAPAPAEAEPAAAVEPSGPAVQSPPPPADAASAGEDSAVPALSDAESPASRPEAMTAAPADTAGAGDQAEVDPESEPEPEVGEIVIEAPPESEAAQAPPAFGAPIQEPVLSR